MAVRILQERARPTLCGGSRRKCASAPAAIPSSRAPAVLPAPQARAGRAGRCPAIYRGRLPFALCPLPSKFPSMLPSLIMTSRRRPGADTLSPRRAASLPEGARRAYSSGQKQPAFGHICPPALAC
ncbi:hypothetical protein DENSPDRAFT_834238 [Dentipellis sp. KUC8613]|nr:hypothetical protein DENSPDRAFT_834238 [Dentipellis sp. KUC8613]